MEIRFTAYKRGVARHELADREREEGSVTIPKSLLPRTTDGRRKNPKAVYERIRSGTQRSVTWAR